MSTAGSFSPSSMESPLDGQQMDTNDSFSTQQVLSIIGNTDINTSESLCRNVEMKIIVQPVDKFRFRYKSEMMGTHGSLLGEREESNHKKEVPTVQLINCPIKDAVIRCTLVTADEDRRYPHPHHLVRKTNDGDDKDDPHDVNVSDENNYTAMFCNMGIIHTAKKNIKEEIIRKRKIEIIEEKRRQNAANANLSTKEEIDLKIEADKAQKWMNLNSVALCFQGFCYDEDGILHPLTEKVYSRPINNLKSALTGELKICRIDKHSSSCDGNEEVWLLVEKVGRKNIKVKFYELDDDDKITWEAQGKFSELDVHHQYAIVFKTPPYKDTNITKPVTVLLKLERPSDGEQSNSIKFIFKPSDKVMNRKRPRLSSVSGSVEFQQSSGIQNSGLNSMRMETMMTLPADNISNLSAEMQKLLDEGTIQTNNSSEIKEFLNDPILAAYCSLLDPLPIEVESDAGLAEFQETQKDFAKEIFEKVLKILKELETPNRSKAAAIIEIRDLLMETTNYGDTALHYALRNEEFELANLFLLVLAIDPSFKNAVNAQNSSGKTPLHMATLLNQSPIVRGLLKLGADPNICDEEDARSLHTAVNAEANECLDELLKSKSQLNLEAHTESGWSALHIAAKVGSLYAIKALIDAGADVNSTDMSYGRTALHIAVDSNHKHIVNYLLKKTKIEVNLKNFGGNTALHSAVVKGGKIAEELATILKKHGADPNIRNNNFHREDEDDEINNDNSELNTSVREEENPVIYMEAYSIAEKQTNLVKATDPAVKTKETNFEYDVEADVANYLIETLQKELTERLAQPSSQLLAGIEGSALTSIIKSEISDSDEEGAVAGDTPFDLARNEPKVSLPNKPNLMTILSADAPQIHIPEELDLKEESEDEMTLLDRSIMAEMRKNIEQSNLEKQQKVEKKQQSKPRLQKKTVTMTPHLQQQLQELNEAGDEKLNDAHVAKITGILDRTGGWERLAQHTNHGSLVRLYKKMSNPSRALFVKIRLQNPNITVRQVKKWLIEIQAFEAASALETK